eukprot:Rhum_TRINITY_DN13928_c0_g1::Rhum_TRINITY_DN13928_c0_g1_i1::g.65469::m.65469
MAAAVLRGRTLRARGVADVVGVTLVARRACEARLTRAHALRVVAVARHCSCVPVAVVCARALRAGRIVDIADSTRSTSGLLEVGGTSLTLVTDPRGGAGADTSGLRDIRLDSSGVVVAGGRDCALGAVRVDNSVGRALVARVSRELRSAGAVALRVIGIGRNGRRVRIAVLRERALQTLRVRDVPNGTRVARSLLVPDGTRLTLVSCPLLARARTRCPRAIVGDCRSVSRAVIIHRTLPAGGVGHTPFHAGGTRRLVVHRSALVAGGARERARTLRALACDSVAGHFHGVPVAIGRRRALHTGGVAVVADRTGVAHSPRVTRLARAGARVPRVVAAHGLRVPVAVAGVRALDTLGVRDETGGTLVARRLVVGRTRRTGGACPGRGALAVARLPHVVGHRARVSGAVRLRGALRAPRVRDVTLQTLPAVLGGVEGRGARVARSPIPLVPARTRAHVAGAPDDVAGMVVALLGAGANKLALDRGRAQRRHPLLSTGVTGVACVPFLAVTLARAETRARRGVEVVRLAAGDRGNVGDARRIAFAVVCVAAVVHALRVKSFLILKRPAELCVFAGDLLVSWTAQHRSCRNAGARQRTCQPHRCWGHDSTPMKYRYCS